MGFLKNLFTESLSHTLIHFPLPINTEIHGMGNITYQLYSRQGEQDESHLQSNFVA